MTEKQRQQEYNRLRNNYNRRLERYLKKGYAVAEKFMTKLPTYKQAKAAGTLKESRKILKSKSLQKRGYQAFAPTKKEAKERGLTPQDTKQGKVYLSNDYDKLLKELKQKLATYEGMKQNFLSWYELEISTGFNVHNKKVKNITKEFEDGMDRKIKEAEQAGEEKGEEIYSKYFDEGEVDIYETGVTLEQAKAVVKLFEKLDSLCPKGLVSRLYEISTSGEGTDELLRSLDVTDSEIFSDLYEYSDEDMME